MVKLDKAMHKWHAELHVRYEKFHHIYLYMKEMLCILFSLYIIK